MPPVLTNLEKVKKHLDQVDDTDQDQLLIALIDQADEIIAKMVPRDRVPGNHPFNSVQATEYYDGKGDEELLLRRRPVTTIARVSVDSTGYYGKGTSAFQAADDWTEGTDFVSISLDETEHNPGILLSLRTRGIGRAARRGGFWPEGRGNILVQYTAGYSTIPSDLEYAANQLVAAMWHASDLGLGGPVDAMRLGDQSFRLLQSGKGGPDLLHINKILAKYRE